MFVSYVVAVVLEGFYRLIKKLFYSKWQKILGRQIKDTESVAFKYLNMKCSKDIKIESKWSGTKAYFQKMAAKLEHAIENMIDSITWQITKILMIPCRSVNPTSKKDKLVFALTPIIRRHGWYLGYIGVIGSNPEWSSDLILMDCEEKM